MVVGAPFFSRKAGIAGRGVGDQGCAGRRATRMPGPSRSSPRWESTDREAGRSARGGIGRLLPRVGRSARLPDALPALAVLAIFAAGESRFRGIRHLHWKESDRIAGVETLATAAGARCVAGDDEIAITGPPRPGRAAPLRMPTFDDHRLAMAAALLSLALPSMLIESPGCVGKSYPGFFRDLETILLRD